MCDSLVSACLEMFYSSKRRAGLAHSYRLKQNEFISSSGLGWASASMNDIVSFGRCEKGHSLLVLGETSLHRCTTNIQISKFFTGSRLLTVVLSALELSYILSRICDYLSKSPSFQQSLSKLSLFVTNLKRNWNNNVPSYYRFSSRRYRWFGRKRHWRPDHLSSKL